MSDDFPIWREYAIRDRLPLLPDQFTGKDVDFVIPLGDNWLATWNWAQQLERDTGIDHQTAIRVARQEFFVGR